MTEVNRTSCPVCGWKEAQQTRETGDISFVNCERCGDFNLSGTARAILGSPNKNDGLLNTPVKKASVGHWLRDRQRFEKKPLLASDVLENLAKTPRLPDLQTQAENLLQLIGDTAKAPGEDVELIPNSAQFIVGAVSPNAVDASLKYWEKQDLVSLKDFGSFDGSAWYASLTFDGWLAYENIKGGKTRGRQAFLATPFDEEDLDAEWIPSMREAVSETGFHLVRLDDAPKPGLIDVRMRLQIKQARFVIVELTHSNNGAYWEAGYAEGLGKPVIYSCRKDHEAHFDVDHSHRVIWEPDKIDKALEVLKATIRNEFPEASSEPAAET